ncbi:MAG TPA: FG-GAP-like repeat-containing protein [Sandaracinaceae bacterium LLY-WYZ-13_1]|nr:FG-GAP-like repeat-containing protein [Sandaracinaceae bacterium LLY-WYZ-13_1]
MRREGRVWVLAGAVLVLSGCAREVSLGVLDAGGAAPADGAPPPVRDECGDGVDDDGDGRIDEGCFCGPGESRACFTGPLASRGVGVCADGAQACVVSGDSSEWGTWGACEGATTAGEEGCDGTDGDCDGAVDEGCACPAGAERPCDAPPGRSSPCRPGAQRCRDGLWSACEGAVRPIAERCGNGVDDDCDGTADEPSLCACRPAPERCGNGVDDDCDGTVDEPDTCRACTPSAETCGDASDEDCDGRIDEGCDGCEPALAPPRPAGPMSTSFVTTRRPTLSWDASAVPSTDFRVRVCADRACATEVERLDVSAETARPASALAPGVYFWNVASLDGAARGCPSPTWEMVVRARDTSVDTRFGSLLDPNGDGFPDVVVGAPSARTVAGSDSSVGRVFVYHGAGAGLPGTLSGIVESPWTERERLEAFGGDLESAGDVNGDGFGDLIVGAQYVENRGNADRPHYRGRAWVFHGGPSGLEATPATELAIPEADVEDRSFGRVVAGLGDVDGDGFGDVAVGSDDHVRVYFGGAGGIDPSSVVSLDLPTADFPNAPLVSAGCDTNGDGLADIVVGDASPADFTGRVYVWEGAARGRLAGPDHTLEPGDGDGPGLGFSVSCAGDVNGDGYADVAAGGPGVRTADSPGRVYVFHGAASGLSTRPDSVAQTADGAHDLGSVVSGLGDVDGDGYDDVVAAMRVPPGDSRIFVALGSGDGLGATIDAELNAPGADVLGYRPPYVADLDGDGRADVLAGGSEVCVHFAGADLAPSWTPAGSLFAPRGAGAVGGFGQTVGGLGSR